LIDLLALSITLDGIGFAIFCFLLPSHNSWYRKQGQTIRCGEFRIGQVSLKAVPSGRLLDFLFVNFNQKFSA